MTDQDDQSVLIKQAQKGHGKACESLLRAHYNVM